MKVYKKKLVKAVNDVLCDVCGNSCTIIPDNAGPDFATLEACWGYGSKYDGTKFDIDLCEKCFGMTIQFLKEHRNRYLNTDSTFSNHYPFNGQIY
jgi:hypothetical protein